MRTTERMGKISLETRKIWNVERSTAEMARSVRDFVKTGEAKHRAAYEEARKTATRELDEITAIDIEKREMKAVASLAGDIRAMERKADRIFAVRAAGGGDRTLAENLSAELDSLVRWMDNDINRFKEESGGRLDDVVRALHETRIRINILFAAMLLTMIGFLLAFGMYIHRKVSVPLGELWEGTEEISRGNMDHQVQVHGETDLVKLGERFNDMAQKLKASYAGLEQKLSERAQQLAALNSVSLTLGQTGNLKEVLQQSLGKIVESFREMEPRGGIFLCEPDGESLRLLASIGLSPEFARQEESIRMGECLCGLAARNGEMIFTERGCDDTRHTRRSPHGSHSHVVVPIKSRGIVLGVMFLYPAKQYALKPSDVQMFDTIGAQLGMAVENLRLYGEVKESSEKYWDLFENSRDILFTTDTEGKLTAVNEAAERFLGHSKVELTGRNILEFLTPEGRERAHRILAGGHIGERAMFEFEIVKPDGGRAFVEISGRNIYRNRFLAGFQMAARDVTEQKRLREMLVKAERLAAIGQVGIAVRHEINNPLTTVIGNAELLLDRYEQGDEELKKRLDVILGNALRIAEIVKRLQEIRQDKTVEYLKGVKMTDLKEP
jgi:PAS domain S-box-containing protein